MVHFLALVIKTNIFTLFGKNLDYAHIGRLRADLKLFAGSWSNSRTGHPVTPRPWRQKSGDWDFDFPLPTPTPLVETYSSLGCSSQLSSPAHLQPFQKWIICHCDGKWWCLMVIVGEWGINAVIWQDFLKSLLPVKYAAKLTDTIQQYQTARYILL